MVILGLGSNVGDRLANLRRALGFLKNTPDLKITRVSPVYISDALLPENAPIEWDQPYLNAALRCETTLKPYDLLHRCKNIEADIGRVSGANWGPRLIDIDILAWDDLIQYDEKLHVPHEDLHTRPFALWPLADVAPHWIYPLQNAFHGKTAAEIGSQWGSRFSGQAPLHTRQILQRIDTPQLMGIMNITPDSFSDGGNIVNVDSALQHAQQLVLDGAEILDIGAEASGPGAQPLTAVEEWQRLEKILPALLAQKNNLLLPPKISVDTRHASVAKKALALGVDWINDVSGLTDPAMLEIVAASDCDIVMMHQLGIPADSQYVLSLDQDPVRAVYEWGEKQLTQLEKLGISSQRLIFDIGIGFGKTAAQSLELIQRFYEFQQLHKRLLVGHSRKSFLTLFTDKNSVQRDIETLPISLYLSMLGVQYIRLHNIEHCARTLKVARALQT